MAAFNSLCLVVILNCWHALQAVGSRVRFPMVSMDFFCHNPYGRTMALGSTQSLTEISTRNNSWWGKGGRCVQLITLPPSCAECLETRVSQPLGNLRSCPAPYMDSFCLIFSREDSMDEVTVHRKEYR
jgi:hypothetical protein